MPAPRLLFVCLGNICRSPTAEAVTRALAEARGLSLSLDSAGTGDWHLGEPPDRRMRDAAARAGYDLGDLRARQVTADDFHSFDILYAMDRQNLRDLDALHPGGAAAELRLFRGHDPEGGAGRASDVPDPYLEGGFDGVVRLIERTSARLLDELGRNGLW
ncbi:MAG: low molecular weight protein-tyrosine-phosphatase [Paracoccaceae bacterium]|jgi:protein-tyrosine phosphatase|nr:low molecular weight protein-tyrosine-phosphatase [Paracoccaceae bacterium]